ncbi:hypothetical protein AAG906_022683 [Vitis piasezkii]
MVKVPFIDFGYLVSALYDVENGISRGLWSDYSLTYPFPTLVQPHYAVSGTERPLVPYPALVQPCYTSQIIERPPTLYPRPRAPQASAPFAMRTPRQFSQLGAGHVTGCYTTLRHAIQDLIDQSLVHLGQPILPPADGIHFMNFTKLDDCIHMLSWDDSEPEPIVVDESYESLFILSRGPDETVTQDVQYVIRGGRVILRFGIIYISSRGTGQGVEHRVPSVLFNNGSSLNVCPLATIVALDFGLSNFEPYSRQFEPMTIHVERFWVHLTVEIEQFYRDHVAFPFDEHGSTVVLDMMRSMSFLPSLGLGLSDKAPDTSTSILVTPPSPDRMSLLTLYFLEETDEYGTSYSDEMLMVDMSQITDDVQPETASPLDLFGVLAIEMVKNVQLVPIPGLLTAIAHDDDVLKGIINLVVVEFEHVDPLLSFDVLSGFVSHSDDQLSVGFLLVVKYLEWLANFVPVPKKDGNVKVCVDFRDLNKASPKDDFPLPHIDMLVDSTTGHSMLSFMDGFSRYNQILMAPKDMEKMSFITKWGTYCYRVMSFGLKNVGATYQRAATTIFHDMMHRDVECTFGVTFGKLLRYMIRAILDMPALSIEREIMGFLVPACIREDQEVFVITSNFGASYTKLSLTPILVSLKHNLGMHFFGWCMYFDGVANHSGYGMGILLISPHGDHIPRFVRLGFSDRHPATNNIVEYEACILGLETIIELGIRQMEVFGDSNMVLR